MVATTPGAIERSTGAIGATITDILGGIRPSHRRLRRDRASARTTPRRGSCCDRPMRSATWSPRPGELGFARAYVAGELDLEGDIFEALALRDRLPDVQLAPVAMARARAPRRRRRVPASARAGRRSAPARPPAQQGARRGRDRAPLRRLERLLPHVLGPSMTYSCAVWSSPDVTLEDAQAAKYELICRKLGLRPGHAPARRRLRLGRHGRCTRRGTTASRPSASRCRERRPTYATRAVQDAGSTTSRSACRTTATSTAASTRSARSACSSTSGSAQLGEYFTQLYELLGRAAGC